MLINKFLFVSGWQRYSRGMNGFGSQDFQHLKKKTSIIARRGKILNRQFQTLFKLGVSLCLSVKILDNFRLILDS